MKKLIIASCFSLAFTAFAGDELELYTGNIKGTYHLLGQELCKRLSCGVKTSNGSIENIEKLGSEVDKKKIAIVQSDILHDAYYGLGTFKNYSEKHVLPLCSLYDEAFTLVVRKTSKINSFRDLKKKIVNVGKENSGSYHAIKKLMALHQMTLADFKYISYLSIDSQGEALCRGTVDAAIYAVGHPSPNIHETSSKCDIKIIPISDASIDKFIQENPAYIKTIIAANTYLGINYAVKTIGVIATLVAPKTLSIDDAVNILQIIKEENSKLKLIHPSLHDINIDTKVPLHPGAEKFYQNKQ